MRETLPRRSRADLLNQGGLNPAVIGMIRDAQRNLPLVIQEIHVVPKCHAASHDGRMISVVVLGPFAGVDQRTANRVIQVVAAYVVAQRVRVTLRIAALDELQAWDVHEFEPVSPTP